MRRGTGTAVVLGLAILVGIGVVVANAGTVRIGFTESLSGKYEVLSGRQVGGLRLWIHDVNAAGGIRLSDGTVVTFEAVSYDDGSDEARVTEGYTTLVTEDGVDFLVSPYSSVFASTAAAVTEAHGKALITAGAAASSTHSQGYTRVFQIYTPGSEYLIGAVDLLSAVAPSLTTIAFVHEDSAFSRDAVTAAQARAEALGFDVAFAMAYAVGQTDFAGVGEALAAGGVEAVLGGGHLVDGSALAEAIRAASTPIRFLTLLVAPPDPSFADLGEAALGVIGPSQWEPQAAFSPNGATDLGISWLGPLGADFVSHYRAEYGSDASYHSAGGYAAGLALEEAIRAADSVRVDAVVSALEALDVLTFFGRLRFETDPASRGLQIGHEMVFVQWRRDPSGVLTKEVVWPLGAATAPVLYPLP